MMTNTFSIFDPCTSTMLSLNWMWMTTIFFLLPFPMWIYQSRFHPTWNTLTNLFFNEFKILMKYSQSNLIILTSLFMVTLINNFLCLFPYIFTSSSHMGFCLSLSLSMWEHLFNPMYLQL